jgi:hypothetical protein
VDQLTGGDQGSNVRTKPANRMNAAKRSRIDQLTPDAGVKIRFTGGGQDSPCEPSA